MCFFQNNKIAEFNTQYHKVQTIFFVNERVMCGNRKYPLRNILLFKSSMTELWLNRNNVQEVL